MTNRTTDRTQDSGRPATSDDRIEIAAIERECWAQMEREGLFVRDDNDRSDHVDVWSTCDMCGNMDKPAGGQCPECGEE